MVRETHAKSILIKRRKIDSWFMTHYGMNLYRGCMHNCAYCDGRSETYRVQGEFGKDVVVKINAIDLLNRELDPTRRRKPMPKSFMMMGGGVCDAYQPVEVDYGLARQTLKLLYTYKYPVHILTKSTLVERDIDLLTKINNQSKAIVCFSFSSTDDEISSIFEPGVPSPTERLATIRKLKGSGIDCGMFLMPVIPFITDTPRFIRQTLSRGIESGIDFVIFGNMTLKAGRQKDYFMKTMQKRFPDLRSRYESIFPENSRWGEPRGDYAKSVQQVFDEAATACGVPKRVPPHIYRDIVGENDLIIVILEHLDYLLKLKNRNSPYGYAAYTLSTMGTPIRDLSTGELKRVKGVGSATVDIVREIMDTGSCALYESLL
jgi:DNA repair photolyase